MLPTRQWSSVLQNRSLSCLEFLLRTYEQFCGDFNIVATRHFIAATTSRTTPLWTTLSCHARMLTVTILSLVSGSLENSSAAELALFSLFSKRNSSAVNDASTVLGPKLRTQTVFYRSKWYYTIPRGPACTWDAAARSSLQTISYRHPSEIDDFRSGDQLQDIDFAARGTNSNRTGSSWSPSSSES